MGNECAKCLQFTTIDYLKMSTFKNLHIFIRTFYDKMCRNFELTLYILYSEKMLRMLVPQHKQPNNAKAATLLLHKITNEYRSISSRFVNISVCLLTSNLSYNLFIASTSTILIDLLESLCLWIDIFLGNRIYEQGICIRFMINMICFLSQQKAHWKCTSVSMIMVYI